MIWCSSSVDQSGGNTLYTLIFILGVLLLWLSCQYWLLAVMPHGESLSCPSLTYSMRWLESEKLQSHGCSHFLQPKPFTLCFFFLLHKYGFCYIWLGSIGGFLYLLGPEMFLTQSQFFTGKTYDINIYFAFFPFRWPVLGLILKRNKTTTTTKTGARV